MLFWYGGNIGKTLKQQKTRCAATPKTTTPQKVDCFLQTIATNIKAYLNYILLKHF